MRAYQENQKSKKTGAAEDDKFSRLLDLSCHKFPTFIPLFKCLERADGPQQIREPSFQALAFIAEAYGSPEDKLFNSEISKLVGTPSDREQPWRELYEADAVFDGCLKFKTFDWVSGFKVITNLSQKIKKPEYKKEIQRIRDTMLREIMNHPSAGLCSCGTKMDCMSSSKTSARLLGSNVGRSSTSFEGTSMFKTSTSSGSKRFRLFFEPNVLPPVFGNPLGRGISFLF